MPSELDYRKRILDDELDELFAGLPAIAVDGAKLVGKTATALRRASTTLRLDDPGVRTVTVADLERALDAPPPILIDEWQLVPPIWDKVRRAVDSGAPPGQFLLTGSASPAGSGTHSGAGRIVSLRMRPMGLVERLDVIPTVSLADLLEGGRPEATGTSELALVDYVDEILRSGFPGMRELDGRLLRAQLDGYLERIVDRDFPELGRPVRNPAGLRRWMTAYAAATATTTSLEKIRDASTSGDQSKPAKTTVQPYREILERLFVLDPVPAWAPTRNPLGHLGSPPKHHLVDPALAARLLGATAEGLLAAGPAGPKIPRDGTLLGALFESLVTQSVRVYAQAAESRVGHLRAHRGEHEIDLIIERADGRVVAAEVKLGAVVDDGAVRHLNWLADRIGDDLLDALVITTGPEAYRRQDGIAVVPAALLGP